MPLQVIVGSEGSVTMNTDVTLGVLYSHWSVVVNAKNLKCILIISILFTVRKIRQLLSFILPQVQNNNKELTCTFAGERCFLFFFFGHMIISFAVFLSFFIRTVGSGSFSSCLMVSWKKKDHKGDEIKPDTEDDLFLKPTHPGNYPGQGDVTGSSSTISTHRLIEAHYCCFTTIQ